MNIPPWVIVVMMALAVGCSTGEAAMDAPDPAPTTFPMPSTKLPATTTQLSTTAKPPITTPEASFTSAVRLVTEAELGATWRSD